MARMTPHQYRLRLRILNCFRRHLQSGASEGAAVERAADEVARTMDQKLGYAIKGTLKTRPLGVDGVMALVDRYFAAQPPERRASSEIQQPEGSRGDKV